MIQIQGSNMVVALTRGYPVQFGIMEYVDCASNLFIKNK